MEGKAVIRRLDRLAQHSLKHIYYTPLTVMRIMWEMKGFSVRRRQDRFAETGSGG
jgi:hypothetical protein